LPRHLLHPQLLHLPKSQGYLHSESPSVRQIESCRDFFWA
jgi:hypothetical protein